MKVLIEMAAVRINGGRAILRPVNHVVVQGADVRGRGRLNVEDQICFHDRSIAWMMRKKKVSDTKSLCSQGNFGAPAPQSFPSFAISWRACLAIPAGSFPLARGRFHYGTDKAFSQPARPRPPTHVISINDAGVRSQFLNGFMRPNGFRSIEQFATSIDATRGDLPLPKSVRDIHPRDFLLAFLLLILSLYIAMEADLYRGGALRLHDGVRKIKHRSHTPGP